MVRITPITKKKEIYSDFTMDMFLNPVNNDLSKRTNENAVRDAIKNLILTDKGERLFQPDVGSNIRKLLFENYSPATRKITEEYISSTITTYEPRAILIDVKVKGMPDENSVMIEITFAIEIVDDPITITVFVNRLR